VSRMMEESDGLTEDNLVDYGIPTEFRGLSGPHTHVVTRRDEDLETYVRWQRDGGALRVSVPFPATKRGGCNKRERSIRVSDSMTPRDALRHARHIRKLLSDRSLELRARFADTDRIAHMRPPDKNGLLGTIKFRRETHRLCVKYVRANGHEAQRVFDLPDVPARDTEGVLAAKQRAIEFVRDMLARGVEVPIRRKHAGLTAAHHVRPLTMYFSTVPHPE
jgi:hypothetical protein